MLSWSYQPTFNYLTLSWCQINIHPDLIIDTQSYQHLARVTNIVISQHLGMSWSNCVVVSKLIGVFQSRWCTLFDWIVPSWPHHWYPALPTCFPWPTNILPEIPALWYYSYLDCPDQTVYLLLDKLGYQVLQHPLHTLFSWFMPSWSHHWYPELPTCVPGVTNLPLS